MRRLVLLPLLLAGCGPTDDGRLLKAKTSLAAQDYAAARQFAQSAADAAPNRPAGHVLLGDALAGLRQDGPAVAAYTAALALDPDRPDVLDRRGDLHLRAGRFAAAVADFDAVLAARPALAPSHWRRGIALYYAGRFADGADQFVAHRQVNPGDVENVVWHYLCVARAETPAAARGKLLPLERERRPVLPEVYELFAGRGSVAAVAAAGEKFGPVGRFYANLYLGLYFDSAGDRPAAVERLTAAVAGRPAGFYMGDVAAVHLGQMTVPPR